ncbi:nuclear transcription factor Y subunit gamma isoform X2 [Dermochelys coriacea]|uniref:nuclear transcription factor Y subunit gamma isoform X2 n=1 Tax=Dermochelys coriacea TaxID=27794 RepID=UPI001CAA3CE6|nr:nuclear transcription factor Y subunit gamma isoform X2 [Dermochelys coriacea]
MRSVSPAEGKGRSLRSAASRSSRHLVSRPLRARSVPRHTPSPFPSAGREAEWSRVPSPRCPGRGGGGRGAGLAVITMSTDGGFGAAGSSDAQQSLQSFWPRVMEEIRNLTVKDFRVQELPLARIKKIMKLDEDVKMISAEAPVLFAKAAQIFITELTLRAWIHTEDNKRRTLQEEVRQAVTPAEPVQYYFTLAQQPAAVQVQGQQQGQQTTTSTTTIQPGQIIIAQPQQGQTTPVTMQVGEGQQVQIVQAQPQGQTQQAQSGTGQTMQVMQQIITNTGEIQQIPVQLNAGQLQYIRLAQPVSGTQVVQGQIQALAANAQQITQTEVQQGQQQFSQFTDGQQLYQIQQVTMPAGQDITQPMFIQSTNQTSDGQAPQVAGD